MNMIEDRIRAAACAAADTVTPDSLPPLRLPAPAAKRGPARLRPRWRTRFFTTPWLAPAAAAAAVILVGVLVVVVRSQTAAPARPGVTPPAPTTPAGYVEARQVPPYFVQVMVPGDAGNTPRKAVVRATSTGAVLAVVPPMRGYTVVTVTAAASDRRFILDEEPWTTTGPAGAARGKLVELNLTNAGRVLGTGPLPFTAPGTGVLNGLVMSPYGDRMAVAYQRTTTGNVPVTDVMVFRLAGPGPSKTWTATGIVTRVSWTADEKELEFTWQTGRSGQPVTARVLDLSSSGGSLLGHSRVAATLVSPGAQSARTACQADSIITPDGTTIVCFAPLRGFLEYSAKSGKLLRVLGPAGGLEARALLWSDASGRVLIGAMLLPGGQFRVGIISGSTFTPLSPAVNPTSPLYGAW
jgi:hypothetical protein